MYVNSARAARARVCAGRARAGRARPTLGMGADACVRQQRARARTGKCPTLGISAACMCSSAAHAHRQVPDHGD